VLTHVRRSTAAGALIAGALIAATGMNAPASYAATAPGAGGVSCSGGTCTVIVTAPGKPGAGSSRPGPGRGSGAGRSTTQPVRQDIPRAPGTPAPPPVYALDPTFVCVPSVGGVACNPPQAAPGAVAPVVVVDPDQVAQMAVSQLAIEAPDIQLVPKVQAGDFGLIGLPVWLWTPPEQWEPISTTATVGGVSVTATAQLTRVDYDMGDGTVLHCDSPGLPYQASFGDRDSPTCGHRYQKTSAHEPNREYTITATSIYDVTWAGAATGATTLTGESNTQLPMGERQILVTVG